MIRLGRTQTLQVWRTAPQGLYLGDPEDDRDVFGDEAVLLPTRWVTADMGLESLVTVFVFLDSEGRPLATTDKPHVEVGHVALLEVLDSLPRVGVFLDWGLSKDLLLPFGEIVKQNEDSPPLTPGDQVVALARLDRSLRITATMRIDHHLAPGTAACGLARPPAAYDKPTTYHPNQPVTALLYAHSPLGYKCVVNGQTLGLLYRNETPTPLPVNTVTPAYVKQVTTDGKLDLRLDPAGYARVDPLAQAILERLNASPDGTLPYHDKSDPADIRTAFDCSKKAFKQALGQLYKQRLIQITSTGITMAAPPPT